MTLVLAVVAGGLAAPLAWAPLAGAGEPPAGARPMLVLDAQAGQDAEKRAPGDLAREGMAKMLQALGRLIESVPQYGLPEIGENGDIILRRKNPEPPAHPVQRQPQGAPENRAI